MPVTSQSPDPLARMHTMTKRQGKSGAICRPPVGRSLPYLILDARYERVYEAGVIVSQTVLIAIGIDWDGRRHVLAVELANCESRSSWRDFLLGQRRAVCTASNSRGRRSRRHGAGVCEVLAEAAYQRCNAFD